MSWIGSASEWKQELAPSILQKVEELENQVDKLKKEKLQKQNQVDVLQQSLDKQKRKVEDETRQKQSLAKELECLGQACESSFQDRGRVKSDITLFRSNGTEEFKRKIDDLESKNRQLESQLSNPSPAKNNSRKFTGTSQDDDFWSHFSSSRRETSIPHNSPFKVAAVKTAIETSQENPFRTPLKTTQKNLTNITNVIDSTTQVITEQNENSKYIKDLENKLAVCQEEIEELKKKSITEISSSMENKSRERNDSEILLKTLKEDISVYKLKAEDAESKLEQAKERLTTVQGELSCQRHNSEAARQLVEKKRKDREQELIADCVLIKSDYTALELTLKELEKKRNQQETLALANQNSLQALLDKTLTKLNAVEKDQTFQIRTNNEIESKLNSVERNGEDLKKMVSQLKQEKDMYISQVDNLKVKHAAAEDRLSVVTSRLESSEQQVSTQKYDMEQRIDQKDSLTKEIDSLKKDLQETQNNNKVVSEQIKEKEKESEDKLNKLQSQLDTILIKENVSCQKLEEMEKNCHSKLLGVHELESEINNLKEKLVSTISEKDSSNEQLKSEISTAQKLKDEEVSALKRQYDNDIEEVNRKCTHSLEDLQYEKNQEISILEIEIVEFEKKMTDLETSESKAKQEKLNCEVALWELDGKLEVSAKAEEKLRKDIENFKLKLKYAEGQTNEKDVELNNKTEIIEKLQEACRDSDLQMTKLQTEFNLNKKHLSEISKNFDEQKIKHENTTVRNKELEISITSLSLKLNETVETLSKEAENAILQNTKLESTFQTECDQLQSEIAKLSEMKCNFDKERESLCDEVANLENEVKSIKEQLEMAANIHKEKLSSVEASTIEKQDRIEVINKENNVLRVEMCHLKEDNNQKKEKLINQEMDIKGNLEKLTVLKAELEESLSQKNKCVSDYEEELINLNISNEAQQFNLEQNATLLEIKNVEMAEVSDKLKEALKTFETDKSEICKLKEQLLVETTASSQCKTALLNSQEDLESSQKESVNLRQKLLKVEEVDNIKQQMESLSQELTSLNVKNGDLNSKLITTSDLLKAAEYGRSQDLKHTTQFIFTALQEIEVNYTGNMENVISKHRSLLDQLSSLQIVISKLDQQKKEYFLKEKLMEEIKLKDVNTKRLEEEMAKYSSDCLKKDTLISDLKEDLMRETKEHSIKGEELQSLKVELQNAAKKLSETLSTVNDERENSSDRIHSLSQNIAGLKAQLAEKNVELNTIHGQTKELQIKMAEIDEHLSAEVYGKNQLQNEYDYYREAMELLNSRSQAESVADDLTIKALKEEITELKSCNQLHNTELKKSNCELILKVEQLKNFLSEANADKDSKYNNLLTLQKDYSDMQFKIDILDDSLKREKAEFDLETKRNYCLMNENFQLDDNVTCLEETMESILSEKKILEEKYQQLSEERNELENVIRELKQNERNTTDTTEELARKIDQHVSTNDSLTEQITALKTEINDDRSAYKSKIAQLQISNSEQIQNLLELTTRCSEFESSLQKLQKTHSITEDELQSTQLDRDKLIKEISTYIQAQTILVEKISNLREMNEAKTQQVVEQIQIVVDLNAKLASYLANDNLYQKISCIVHSIIPKMLSVLSNEILLKNDLNIKSFQTEKGVNLGEKTKELLEKYEGLLEELKKTSWVEIKFEVSKFANELLNHLEEIILHIAEDGRYKAKQFIFQIESIKQQNTDLNENLKNLQKSNELFSEDTKVIVEDCEKMCIENRKLREVKKELEEKCATKDQKVAAINDDYNILKKLTESQVELICAHEEKISLIQSTLSDREAEYESTRSNLESQLSNNKAESELTLSFLEKGKLEFEKLLEEKLELESQMKSYGDQLKTVNHSLSVLENEKDELLKTLKEYLEEKESLITSMSKLNLEIENKDLQTVEDGKIISELNKKLVSSKTREELDATLTEAKINIKSLEGKLALSCKNIRKMEKEEAKSQSHIDKLNADRKHQYAKVREVERTVKEKEGRLAQANIYIEDLKLQCQQKVESVSLKEEEKDKLQMKIAVLEKSNIDYKDKIIRMNNSQKKLQLEMSKLRSHSSSLQKTGIEPEILKKTDKDIEIDSNSECEIPPSLDSQKNQINLGICDTSVRRRSTRLSINKYNSQSVKRRISDSPGSNHRRKVMRFQNSNLEGLPHKIIQGLNNIPEGNESPGIIRRPTTPMKTRRTRDVSIASRRPLEAIDTNSPVKSANCKDTNVFLPRRTPRTKAMGKKQPDECKTQ